MILEIEYYKGDTQLIGRKVEFHELKDQLDEAEKLHDRKSDDFIDLLCSKYGWDENGIFARPDYVYDRDIKKLLCSRSQHRF